jgi:nicotinate-nucleotide--dimethylbenzimidazole phosphoribosyltransferase
MNETIDLILHRRSVRAYSPDPIPQDVLDAILLAGCAAPYGGPEEPWRALVIQRKETKEALLNAWKAGIDRAYGGPPETGYWNTQFGSAPVVIAMAFKPTSMGEYPERIELGIGVSSAACAIENMLLASHAQGLGACWFGPFSEAKGEFEEILGIERPWEFLALVALGYPAERARRDTPKLPGKMIEFLDG